MTRTLLSAEPETTRSEQGLKRRLVTGKSCARRMVMMDCVRGTVNPCRLQTRWRKTHAKSRSVQYSHTKIRRSESQ